MVVAENHLHVLLLLAVLASHMVTCDFSGLPFAFASANFTASLRSSVHRLSQRNGPLLLHARNEAGLDAVMFLKDGEDQMNHTVPLNAPLYYNLMAVSHLPVTVVADIAPDFLPSSSNTSSNGITISPLDPTTIQSLNETLEVIEQVRSFVTASTFPNPGQVERQLIIINKTELFIQTVTKTRSVSVEELEELISSVEEELKENAYDAVVDYLQNLNETITELLDNQTITLEDFNSLSVIIDLPPFRDPDSFLVQYYEQLLGYRYQMDTAQPNRIFISPDAGQELSVANATTTFSYTRLNHFITRTFYTREFVFSSTHLLLSRAAEAIICSPILSFPTCSENGDQNGGKDFPSGFSSRTERTYVVVIVFLCGMCSVLVIVVVCVFREGKIMRRERRSEKSSFLSQNGPSINQDVDEEGEERGGGEGGGGGSKEETRDSRSRSEIITPLKSLLNTNKRRRGWIRTETQTSSRSDQSTRRGPSVTYTEVSVNQ